MTKHAFIPFILCLGLAAACDKGDGDKKPDAPADSGAATKPAAKDDKAATKPAVATPSKPLIDTFPDKLTKKGIKFTKQDDTEKRKGKFNEKNQAVIKSITKFKFPDTTIQLIVVTLNDASRKNFIDIELTRKFFNELKKADAEYTDNGLVVAMQDDTTRLLLIHKSEDKKLADKIAWALK
jgi:hypothetical protein